ncbi:MAG: hypothetical protein HY543_01285, partial [Deltaproteobacteria bacterium]|nr:hypothetical protein [Deltaproteobacteria bacterium]
RTVTPLANGLGLTFIFADDPGWDVTGTVRWHRTIPQRFGTPIYEGGVEFQASDRARFSAFAARVGLAIS